MMSGTLFCVYAGARARSPSINCAMNSIDWPIHIFFIVSISTHANYGTSKMKNKILKPQSPIKLKSIFSRGFRCCNGRCVCVCGALLYLSIQMILIIVFIIGFGTREYNFHVWSVDCSTLMYVWRARLCEFCTINDQNAQDAQIHTVSSVRVSYRCECLLWAGAHDQ